MTDFINGHAFSEISTASTCRNGCGWTWTEIDTSAGWSYSVRHEYAVDFGTPRFETPPLCPNLEDGDLEIYAPNGTEKHMAYGKEWEWPKGEYKDDCKLKAILEEK